MFDASEKIYIYLSTCLSNFEAAEKVRKFTERMAPVEKCFREDKALRVVRSGAVWRIWANTVLRIAATVKSCESE